MVMDACEVIAEADKDTATNMREARIEKRVRWPGACEQGMGFRGVFMG